MIGGEPRPTEESTAVDWWSPATAAQHMDETFAVRVFDAIDAGDTAVRLHDGAHLLADGGF
jgi:hypothetical protein